MTSSPTAGTTVLELADVQKSFGAVRALRTVDLSVQAGSIHALVGENGAGKSTLVKIVAGVHRRDAGRSGSRATTSTSAPPPSPRPRASR